VNAPKTVMKAVTQRAGGKRASWWQASVTAVAVGGAVGMAVYRGLRNA
jgi:predicted phage tail protein